MAIRSRVNKKRFLRSRQRALENGWHLLAAQRRQRLLNMRTLGHNIPACTSRSTMASPTRRKGNFPRIFKRSEEHTSELQSLMRISYAVFCLQKKIKNTNKRIQ